MSFGGNTCGVQCQIVLDGVPDHQENVRFGGVGVKNPAKHAVDLDLRKKSFMFPPGFSIDLRFRLLPNYRVPVNFAWNALFSFAFQFFY